MRFFFASMTDQNLRRILAALDTALDVYRHEETKLSANDISVKSMLVVLRNRIAEQLERQQATAES